MLTKSKTLLIAATLLGSTTLANADNHLGVSIYIPTFGAPGADAYAQQVPTRAGKGQAPSTFAEENERFERIKRLD
jgi:hypothetical protein